MTGTFRFGDRLIIEYVALADVGPGDVVVYRTFNHAQNENERVHRVMRIVQEGLVVRGDNNPCADKTLVSENNLVGRVAYVERDGKCIPVRSGWPGLLLARIGHEYRGLRGWAWGIVRLLGRAFYGRLRDSGLVVHLWRPSIERIRLLTEKGQLVKYVCRNRTVACYWPENGRFECRKPYDLVLLPNEVNREAGKKQGEAKRKRQ